LYNPLIHKVVLVAVITFMVAAPSVDAFDQSRQRDGFAVSRADHQRLQRDYRSLVRQSKQNLRHCSETNAATERTYRQQLKQQSVLRSSIQDTSTRNAETLNAIALKNELPRDFFDRPTLDKFEALQGRYQALIQAYRNLERDHNALQQSELNGRQSSIAKDEPKSQMAASAASSELTE